MNPERKAEETFYDILKVDDKATVAEIVAAYHTAKNAFSRDSVATYSLFSAEEAQSILSKLEQAYLTLSNLEKKREYDEVLKRKAEENAVPPMTELELKQNAQLLPKEKPPSYVSFPSAPAEPTVVEAEETPAPIPVAPSTPAPASNGITGSVLKEIREKRSMSLEDVSRITKIPTKFIQAIESENVRLLPARVYLQGFVKNLSTLYRLDPKAAVTSYLSHVDKLQSDVVKN